MNEETVPTPTACHCHETRSAQLTQSACAEVTAVQLLFCLCNPLLYQLLEKH